MALVVNTNIASLNSQYSLSQSRSALEQAMERLSSGSKINSAGDNAAGLSIATRMDSQIRGLEAAISNANDGISLLQTAEGAMEEITSMLQRMRELAVQSSNGVNTQEDRDALNAEAQQLLSEIDRVVGNTTFNNQSILDGSMNASLQIGTEAGQSLGVSLGNLSTYALGADIASSSGSVQREATFAGSAVGSTDINGNNLVTATSVNLTFEADDTYNFALTLELKDNDGNARLVTYDIEGVVAGSSARDIASAINTALRKPPVDMTAAISGGTYAADSTVPGAYTEVINSAADLVDVSYSGNNVVITNNLGGDVKVEAGNFATSTGVGSSLSGPISQAGGQIRFTPVAYRESDGSSITTGLAAPVVLGTQPDYNDTSFTIQSAAPTTTGGTTATTATAATLEVSFNDITDATVSTVNQISNGDTIAFTLVDADGASTLVYTDSVSGLSNSTNLVAALNNALIAAGADDEYSIAWGDNASGGSADGSTTTPGTFVITRADGTNFTLKMGGVDSDGNAISSSFASTDSDVGSGSIGLARAVVDLAQADSSYKTSDGDITLNFSDTVAGSAGATPVLTAGDGFTLTLTDATGTARSVTVENLQDGSASTVVAALNNAFTNAGITDLYTASVDGGFDMTGGITLTHGSDSQFTLAFSDLTLGGATTGITTVIHEKIDDLEFGTTVDTNLYSTNGVQATVAGTAVTTNNAATMYLDVMGADTYTLSFAKFDSTNTTSTFSHSYDGTAASLTTFASKIAANLGTMAGFDFTVTAEDGRIAITENDGTGFKVNSFASTGAGRIFASADSSLIASGDKSAVMLDDTSYATTATADSGVAGINVTETQVKLTFDAATDTYSFTVATDDGVAKVNAFQYGSNSGNADAVAAITVALQSAGLDGKVSVEATGTHGVIVTVEDGTELDISNFTSVGSGKVQAESIAGTYGSGVTRILQDDVMGSANALANLDLSTANGAISALDALDRAIQDVSNERSNIGALTNRLDHTISNLGNIVVNTSAAQSRIQDADFASEAAELAKAQVLQQAGTAILAQANASVQSVLSLLG